MIALARSAAPAAISQDAGVMLLGRHGYETAIRGKNGFVCIVEGDPVRSRQEELAAAGIG
ncbi:MAG TPA: hypothetical protein VKS01_05705 [Bryobacteraceae bacterium]|nr:hypothetical protein [Bryobacteraceae bacterium]